MKNIPGYEILDTIGAGKMGTVYKARQISMDRIVALKILSENFISNEIFIKRFIREARSAARLSHPNIIMIIDVGKEDDLPYFVMEYIFGNSLKKLMESSEILDETYCIHVIKEITKGLKHALRENIIHRDLKPNSILLSSLNQSAGKEKPKIGTSNDVVKIADLGLAKFEEEQETSITSKTPLLEAPYYISPEQILGKKDIDFRSDIYSLGAIFYHMATGAPPFDGKSIGQIMTSHLSMSATPVQKTNPNLSSSCSDLISKMMQKDPKDRYQNYDILLDDLQQLAKGEKLTKRPTKNAKQSKSYFKITIVVLVLTLLVSSSIILVPILDLSHDTHLSKNENLTPQPKADRISKSQNPIQTVPKQKNIENLYKRAKNLEQQSLTQQISFWKEAQEELKSLKDQNLFQESKNIDKIILELNSKLKNLLDSHNKKIAQKVEDFAKKDQWINGINTLDNWSDELKKLCPKENIPENYVLEAKKNARNNFWRTFRKSFDQKCKQALTTRKAQSLRKSISDLPETLNSPLGSLSLKNMLNERLDEIEGVFKIQDQLEKIRQETSLIDIWDPGSPISGQINQIESITQKTDQLSKLKSEDFKKNWFPTLMDWQDHLKRSVSFQMALNQAIDQKKSFKLSIGRLRRFTKKDYNPKVGLLTLYHNYLNLEKIISTRNLNWEVFEQLRSKSVVSKLSPQDQAILKSNTHALSWLLSTKQFFLAKKLLSSIESSNDFSKIKTLMQCVIKTQQYPLPHHYNPNNNFFRWQTTFKNDAPSKWFVQQNADGKSPQKPMESTQDGLKLNGHTITFLPALDSKDPWSLEGIAIPHRDESLKIILTSNKDQGVFFLNKNGISYRQNFSNNLMQESVQIREKIPIHWRLRHSESKVVFELNEKDIISVPTFSKERFRVSFMSHQWTLQMFCAKGIPNIDLPVE